MDRGLVPVRIQNQIDISSEGVIEIQGFLPAYDVQAADTLLFWVQTFVQRLGEAEKLYAELHADGRLIGQERFHLIELLDTAMNHLIVLRQRICRDEEFSLLNFSADFKLNVIINGPRWSARGRLGKYAALKASSGGVWFSRIRRERLKGLVELLGKSLADGFIDAKERTQLDRAIDRLVFSFIIMRNSITSGAIS
jgi:hypothetical protein